MSRPVVVGAGDCVMQAILQGLRHLPGADNRVEIRFSQFKAGGVPPDVLQRCRVLIEEAWPWNGNKTLADADRALLPADCTTIRVPALHFNSLWPLVVDDPRNRPDAVRPSGLLPYAVGDRLALQVMQEVADPRERLSAYLGRSPLDLVNLDRFHQLTMDDFFRRERACDVRVADYVLENFRQRRLFFSHTSPSPALLSVVLMQIYRHPAFRDLFETPDNEMSAGQASAAFDEWAATSDAFADCEAPIHPDIAEHFGLQWHDPAASYAWNGHRYSFEQWIAFYLSYSPGHASVAA